ncbi:MAG: ribbon-helix-helix domain-containing protein [Hyphomicrobiaceae bacterium]|nr:ribbon-helix-helix domain-containing protein [Hyphomicrobiaceae bacterium]
MTRPLKRSFSIRGHRTSISLEPPFWDALKEVAASRDLPVARLVAEIDAARASSALSSAVRVYLLRYYREHGGAGHR